MKIQMYVQLDKETSGTGNIRSLNLATVKLRTVQVSNCRFLGLNTLRHRLLHYPALIDAPVYSRTLCQCVLWIKYNMYTYPLLYCDLGWNRCSKGTPIIKKRQTPPFLSEEEQRKKGKKTRVPEGLDARSDRAGWLPAVSYCSAPLV
jgi:hypothetical protein